jgi:hypothetical protein
MLCITENLAVNVSVGSLTDICAAATDHVRFAPESEHAGVLQCEMRRHLFLGKDAPTQRIAQCVGRIAG